MAPRPGLSAHRFKPPVRSCQDFYTSFDPGRANTKRGIRRTTDGEIGGLTTPRAELSLAAKLSKETVPPHFSFDPTKNVQNLETHKLPLAFGMSVLMNRFGEVEDRRRDYGERRA